MENHTPGPWEITENLGMDEAWCNWHRVGPVDLMGGSANANSRLIAAAPDMLESLKMMVSDFEQRVQVLGNKTDIAEVEAVTKARAVIAKAEGKS